MTSFHDGIAAVMKDSKWGYINTKGEEIIPLKFEQAGPFGDDLACVDTGDGQICFINTNGDIVIKTPYKFSMYYMNSLVPDYLEGISFYNGICTIHTEDDKDVWIDKNGKVIPTPTNASINDEVDAYSIYQENEKRGIKDSSGKIIIKAIYDDIEVPHNGVALATIIGKHNSYEEYYPIFGYVDLNGYSTFTDSDYAEMRKNEKESEEKLEREEEERFAEMNESKGPEWINGTWEYKGIVYHNMGSNSVNAKLIVDRYNQRLICSDSGEIIAKGTYTISDNNIHCDGTYFPLDMDNRRIGLGGGKYYHKVSDSCDYSSNARSNNNTGGNFRSGNDVMQYLSGKTFSAGGLSVRIGYDAVYLNGTATSAAPRVTNITSNTATIRASSPYMGGQDLKFYLNAGNGTIGLDSGELLYLR